MTRYQRKNKVPVYCENCDQEYEIVWSGKLEVCYCAFCGDDVSVADADDHRDDDWTGSDLYEPSDYEDEDEE